MGNADEATQQKVNVYAKATQRRKSQLAMFAAVDADPGTMLPWSALIIGFLIAAGSAFLCVDALLRVVERVGMTPFAIYRVLLGLALLTFF